MVRRLLLRVRHEAYSLFSFPSGFLAPCQHRAEFRGVPVTVSLSRCVAAAAGSSGTMARTERVGAGRVPSRGSTGPPALESVLRRPPPQNTTFSMTSETTRNSSSFRVRGMSRAHSTRCAPCIGVSAICEIALVFSGKTVYYPIFPLVPPGGEGERRHRNSTL